EVAIWIDGKQAKTFEVDPAEGAKSFDVGVQGLIGESREFRTRITAGDHSIAASILHLYDGLPPMFKGPNPSTRPTPPPPDYDKIFKIRPNATPAQLAKRKLRIEALKNHIPQVNSANVSYIEVIGPYNEAKGPSEASLKKIYVCGHLDGNHGPDCAREIVTNLARRAFRHPVTPSGVQPYLRLVSMVRNQGGSFDEGISVALQAILVSPDFLFRIERDPANEAPGETHPISQYELASRLSYFLWSSMPDGELMRCAQEGTLRNPQVLAAQVRRMLRDPKSDALVENFGGQWLEFRRLESVEPDHNQFPRFDEYLRMSMQKETELFLESIVHEDRSILDLIDGKYTFLNERLADFYGIPGVKGPEFRRVDLTNDPERGGVLTQASVLTVSSYATRTSPVLRGKWILDNILNDPPPPPPPGVSNLNLEEVGTSMSLRDQMEEHRKNPACASCHQKMDPLGFGLSNYNAIGHWRTADGRFPIDASGTLPDGRSFVGSQGLKKILLGDRAAFAQCVTEKLLTYALGRGLERYDNGTVKAIVNDLGTKDYRFSALVLDIVNSLPFQQRSTDRVKGEEVEAKR
ncbi:MAG TPA: DUF1592 domain-containing protein, partial [Bryobacteraceae bacterium]|nr:DUF1592 domain-containing protein [Bryobacteraceae bacterium]